MNQIPRSEHPKPQFERKNWLNLNGEWQFEIDNGRSGEERALGNMANPVSGKITVPFCPQSVLSGVHHTDFIYGLVYRRLFPVTDEQKSGRVVLHFGAVDYECTVYINGEYAGRHIGGYVSFSMEITDLVHAGENSVAVFVRDNERDPLIPRGKQSEMFHSHGCDYTRTTGIWQTVWLEFMPKTCIRSARYYPSIEDCSVTVQAQLYGSAEWKLEAFYDGKPVGSVSAVCTSGSATLTLPLSEKHLWEIGHGRLYDLRLTYGDDVVQSYFGLRSVGLDSYRFLLNGKSVFQRLVLDQGFYPDGIYTAPSDEALKNDISLSLACGFNGARLHQKIFEERFLYHADRMGYIVWGEFPDWGMDHSDPASLKNILGEWIEEVNHDFNHPSIVGWCPRNETWDYAGRHQDDRAVEVLYQTTKVIDPSRPCIDTSGNFHVITDIYDVHNYQQDPAVFRTQYENLPKDGTFYDEHAPHRQHYPGKQTPVFVSEYGGIAWTEGNDGWGYGNGPKTKEEFIDRFIGLADVLLSNPCICALCYTQLTDVEQEKNGLYRYDRTPKFDTEIFRAALTKKAAIED